jgi:hypothetical protein
LRDADERAREAAQGVAAVVEQLGVALGLLMAMGERRCDRLLQPADGRVRGTGLVDAWDRGEGGEGRRQVSG